MDIHRQILGLLPGAPLPPPLLERPPPKIRWTTIHVGPPPNRSEPRHQGVQHLYITDTPLRSPTDDASPPRLRPRTKNTEIRYPRPHNWITTTDLHNLEFWAMPTQIRHLRHTATACRLRTALWENRQQGGIKLCFPKRPNLEKEPSLLAEIYTCRNY